MSAIPSSFLYQAPPDAALKVQYVNQKIEEVQAPAAVIDVAVVKRNCNLMLSAAKALKVQFRAHVKTHKTIQLAQLQVGETGPVRLIVSTIPELEHMLPWLLECIKQERDVNVLYGIPASPSSLPRLAKLAHVLGGSKYLSLMVDHADTLDFITQSHGLWPGAVRIFVKIDTGYHRSGITYDSSQLQKISSRLKELERHIALVGLYSHLGHSYGFNSPSESIQGLIEEFEVLAIAAKTIQEAHGQLTLSVGATPTATAAQYALFTPSPLGTGERAHDEHKALEEQLEHLKKLGYNLELHAGVYPVLDLQQMATHARFSDLTYSNIGLSILAEVASLYPEREKPEALIAAGSLVLGREPCKSYPGWGVVSPWQDKSMLPTEDAKNNTDSLGHYSENDKTGWIVGKVSQEHGILTWEGSSIEGRKLRIGEKLLVWPNHACVAGSGFGWYLVVDSESEDADVVRDVWVRCRGW